MTVVDADVVRILEDLLPARFGGGAEDYQLVEDQVAPDGSSLRLLVHPRLGPVDPAAVTRLFFDTLGAVTPSAQLMGLTWNGSGLLRVERRPPHVTGSGPSSISTWTVNDVHAPGAECPESRAAPLAARRWPALADPARSRPARPA